MNHQSGKAEVWEEQIKLPTYEIGKPDKNPMFLEKRVYQGSSGKVYPYPVIDKIYDEKVEKEYRAVYLENDYIRVMVLPELGGRIQRAYDKTNDYDFVYYNEVIKPALVGLTGPWISGGIEFNWPQHHRPTTFAPVDYILVENPDGSRSVKCSEVDQMYGTKGEMIFTVYPDKAYIEITGQLYNRTNLPQTFLWWANPAVPVNDHTQSIFPPDVHAVFDHGKRDVSKFPIATGVYYKHDYGAGVDISRYKNIPVPTSYMCAHSDYNFVGGYDYGVEAGVLHVCDHHVSPGKKQWTWGCGDFGKAWDRNLTDENGPYIELMTGVFTDNQPDFTWLKPFEEKVFTQYFMPYKKAANVKNASTEIVMNLETDGREAAITVYATAKYENARIVLEENGQIIFEKETTVSPVDILEEKAEFCGEATGLKLTVCDKTGREMLSYKPEKEKIEKTPDPMPPAKLPEEIQTIEELYLTGLHIEQYRHATYEPDVYYLEGLKRDPGDIRINTAYGCLLLRRGLFAESEKYFQAAIGRMTERNPNPYNSEAYFDLGLSLFYQGRLEEAYDAFFKSTWTAEQQEMGFYYLAAIASQKKNYMQALTFIERSLVKNYHNLKARALKGRLLMATGQMDEAERWLKENLKIDAFDYYSRLALEEMTRKPEAESGNLLSSGEPSLKGVFEMMADRASSFIECAIDLGEAGFFEEAAEVVRCCKDGTPMLKYYEAYFVSKAEMQSEGEREGEKNQLTEKLLEEAAAREFLYCFPNKLEDILVLQFACERNPMDSKAPYYLACLFYDKKQYQNATKLWEQSASKNPDFPAAWRNLSLAYYNKEKNPAKALECMERAYALDTADARILLELVQLYHKLGKKPEEIFMFLEEHREVAFTRDDLYVEYVMLLNLQGRYEEAYELIMKHKFHPWEGGEGKVTTQYAVSLTEMARIALKNGDTAKAKELLEKALVFPENLGEGKLEGAKDNNIYYYLGLCEEKLGNESAAKEYLERAAAGDEEPAGMMYYNDQPADLILYEGLANRALGREERALERFHKLVDYGEKHYFDEMKIDYFAVSLPDLQLFEEDLSMRNRAHCEYLIGLGQYGLGNMVQAAEAYGAVLAIDPSHEGTILHKLLL